MARGSDLGERGELTVGMLRAGDMFLDLELGELEKCERVERAEGKGDGDLI